MSLDTQRHFAQAATERHSPLPEGLLAWNGQPADRGFEVYRNNVAVGLTGALASRFPVTQAIVGNAFFDAMALEFVRRNPPRSPLLLAYGDDFAAFAATFEAASELTYLPDVISLEIARSRAYHAADARVLTGAELAALPPENLPGLRLKPHPSLSILRSDHPFVTIWAMNAGECPLAPISAWVGEDAIVLRPQMMVNIHRLPPGGAVFLKALSEGAALCEATELGSADAADFDLSANLAGALQAGAFTAIHS